MEVELSAACLTFFNLADFNELPSLMTLWYALISVSRLFACASVLVSGGGDQSG